MSTTEKVDDRVVGLIRVRRESDGKVFSSDMREDNVIYEMHFCTSYTQVFVQEADGIYLGLCCPPIGTNPSWWDMVVMQDVEKGVFL